MLKSEEINCLVVSVGVATDLLLALVLHFQLRPIVENTEMREVGIWEYLSTAAVVVVLLLCSDAVAEVNSQSQKVPTLFVFGDSLVEVGNNFLNTLAKANYFPYDNDFSGGHTGRFSNGKSLIDFIGKLEEVIENLTEAILLNATSAIMYATRAGVYIKMKKPNAAIRDANAALEGYILVFMWLRVAN